MTEEEIKNIQIGDRFYVTSLIRKKFFNTRWFPIYKPDKFYEVTKVELINYRVGFYKGRGIKITSTSEIGENRIYFIRGSKVCPYMVSFCLVKEKIYKEISSVDIFEQLLCTGN